jgi:hypothetical protein
MIKAGFNISDVWSNPHNEREIFIAANNQLIYNSQGRASFGINTVPYNYAYSFAVVSTSSGKEKLFAGTDFGVVYIDRRGAGGGGLLGEVQKFIKDHSDDPLFWPVTAVLSFVSAYALALFCTLVFKFLPIPAGFVGTDWIVSIIGQPLSISPRLGQWFLFVGYRSKLRRKLAEEILAVGNKTYRFDKRLADGCTKAVSGNSPLEQLRNSFNSGNLVFVINPDVPTMPAFLASSATSKKNVGGNEIPILLYPPYALSDIAKIDAGGELSFVY